MTNKTFQIYGYGFGPTDASIEVTLVGNTVFNGTIPTVNQPAPPLPDFNIVSDTVVLCSFELPMDFVGTIPMTCKSTNGTVVFAQIGSNYVSQRNPIYSDSDWTTLTSPAVTRQQIIDITSQYASPPFTQDEINTILDPATNNYAVNQILSNHNVSIFVNSGPTGFSYLSNDPRTNIFIDGREQTPDHQTYPGTYWWLLREGSTLSYNLNTGVQA